MKYTKYNWFELLLLLCGGLVLLYIVAPLVSMALGVSLGVLLQTTADKEVYSSIWLTLWTSVLATLALSVIAVPFAYFLARKELDFY